MSFNGIELGLGNLARLSNAKSRSICAENFTGEKGKAGMALDGISKECARDLGRGWKISPAIYLKSGSTFDLANVEGPGVITHIWMTCAPEFWRNVILRFYWDGEETPSVECPMGDFFCCGWCERTIVNALPVSVMTAGGMNSYFSMPFQKLAKIQVENIGPMDITQFFFQIDYALTDIPEDMAYFHAQWRRSNPVPYKEVHTLLDGVRGRGHYVGTYFAWQTNSNGWWGEGELKFYMDGDREFPTICGTGTEDYFGGAWAFEGENGSYGAYSAPYLGFHQVIVPDGYLKSNTRFGMYRFHVMDPIRFEEDLRVTVQALGWRSEGRYLPLQDDIASVAYWYQTEPHGAFPVFPGKDALEVI